MSVTSEAHRTETSQEEAEQPASVHPAERILGGAPVTQGAYGDHSLQEPGLYVSPQFAESLPGELPQFTGIQLLPGERLGAADSARGVVFGEATISTDEGELTREVAFKPFGVEQDAAENEYQSLLRAREAGFETLEPLAIGKEEDGSSYLITAFRPDISTLDNVDWTIPPSDEDRYAAEVVPNLEFIASNMGRMHAKGLFHGDAQAKNFAQSDTGEPVVVDLENASFASSPDELEHSFTRGGSRDGDAYQDMAQCWWAMTHPASTEHTNFLFAEEYDPETHIHTFEQHYLLPYLKALQEDVPPELLDRLQLPVLHEALVAYARRIS